MRVVSTRTIKEYYETFPDTEQPLKSWLDEARRAAWKTPQDIKSQYANASILGKNRVVFNIRGNKYRLIVAVAYQLGALYIKFIGTHSEYDQINAETVGD